ncbi:MAG: hypothetical protein O3A25_12005 [Acidobacteria bacterium]|nr:hypothetical protein [Acidobacteriota bacterium]
MMAGPPPLGMVRQPRAGTPAGRVFLDPAGVVARHVAPEEPFSLTYVHHPYLGILEDQ